MCVTSLSRDTADRCGSQSPSVRILGLSSRMRVHVMSAWHDWAAVFIDFKTFSYSGMIGSCSLSSATLMFGIRWCCRKASEIIDCLLCDCLDWLAFIYCHNFCMNPRSVWERGLPGTAEVNRHLALLKQHDCILEALSSVSPFRQMSRKADHLSVIPGLNFTDF